MEYRGHLVIALEEAYVEPVPEHTPESTVRHAVTFASTQTEAKHTASAQPEDSYCHELISRSESEPTEQHTVCSHCSQEPVHPHLNWWRGTLCPETCAACMSCIRKFALNDKYICPTHSSILKPVVGGKKAFALVIQEQDLIDERVGRCSRMDSIRMVELASHPEVMQIPYKNVFSVRMPPRKYTACMERAIEFLETALSNIYCKSPSCFFLYYSGHQLVRNKNKTKCRKECQQFVEILQTYIHRIGNICPQMLIILDCCYAAAAAELLCSRHSTDDAHVEWCIQILSSKTNQKSGTGDWLSVFTDIIIPAFKGGSETECPYKIPNCNMCLKYKKHCSEKGYITGCDIENHLLEHSRHGELSQTPVVKRTCSSESIISFFNTRSKLYNVTVQFQSVCDQNVEIETDDVLDVQEILRQAKADQQDAHHLKFYQHFSKQSSAELGIKLRAKLIGHFDAHSEYMPNDLCRDILEAVSKNSQCLLIKIDDMPVKNLDDKSPAKVFHNTCIFSPPAYYDSEESGLLDDVRSEEDELLGI